MSNSKQDEPVTWVYGKVEPGWYCAMWGWKDSYAKHLESLGYRVVASVHKPKEP